MPFEFFGRDERQILVGKIESGFEVPQKIEQSVAQGVQRLGQSAGKLLQGDVQLLLVVGVDYTENGLGLGKVYSTREKRSQGELAGLGQPGAGGAKLLYKQIQQRRTAQRVQLGNGLARVAFSSRPKIKFAPQGRGQRVQMQGSGQRGRTFDVGRFLGSVSAENGFEAVQYVRPAHTHNAPSRTPRR